MTLTFTDIFCGAGGSSLGLAAAGLELKLAANHWDRAIETHAANFRDADHLCADVSNYDMRRLPRTDVLWASPECTWHSPAGGRKKMRGQLDRFEDYVADDGGVRSRATMLDVIRASEVHNYPAVIVENVIEVADWPLFDWWLKGMETLGYRHQIVCVSSAHVGSATNQPAPQWRDRLYVVFTRSDVRVPNVESRPLAWCSECDKVIASRQSWKRTDRRPIGKYGQQYVYRCPHDTCGRIVEPFVLPAAAAIDWTDVGQRIGDRVRPLAENTLRRIRAGLAMFAQPTVVGVGGNKMGERPGSDYVRAWPALEAPLFARTGTPADAIATPGVVFNVNHAGDDGRPYPANAAPLAPRTTKIGDGVLTPAFFIKNYGNADEAKYRAHPVDNPLGSITTHDSHSLVALPFVTMLRRKNRATGMDEPLATLAADGRHHALTTPPGAFYVKNFGGNCRPEDTVKGVDYPLGAITTKDHHALVIPYRRTSKPTTTSDPLPTVATREQHALVSVDVDVDDCHFRMLKPREHLRGQRFHDSYVVTGNLGEQTMQAGNAVSSNVSQWLGECIAEVLG